MSRRAEGEGGSMRDGRRVGAGEASLPAGAGIPAGAASRFMMIGTRNAAPARRDVDSARTAVAAARGCF